MTVLAFSSAGERQISEPNATFSRWLGRYHRPIAPTQVAFDLFGRVFVVYDAQGGFGIFGRIVMPDGTMLPEITIEQSAPYFPHSASVAAGLNSFAVVYRREGEALIKAQLYNMDGSLKFGAPVTIAADLHGSSELAPTIVWPGVDAYVVVWNSGSSTSGYRTKYCILDARTNTASDAVIFGEETCLDTFVQVVMTGSTELVKVSRAPTYEIRMEACSLSSDLYGNNMFGVNRVPRRLREYLKGSTSEIILQSPSCRQYLWRPITTVTVLSLLGMT